MKTGRLFIDSEWFNGLFIQLINLLKSRDCNWHDADFAGGGNGDNGDGDGDDSVGDGAMTMAIIVMILVTMILTMMRKSVSVCAGGAVAVATWLLGVITTQPTLTCFYYYFAPPPECES